MILETPTIDPARLATERGWEAKPEGLCRGEECVPLPPDATTADGMLDAAIVSERLRMPLVADEAAGIWALGPRSGGQTLDTAVAPDLTLPDVDGNPFSLASLHGRKVLLVAWASW